MLSLFCGLFALSLTAPAPPTTASPTARKAGMRAAPLRGSDIMATVEGQSITRTELTYFWMQTDARINALLGEIVANRWKTDRGKVGKYMVTEAEIFQQLYGGGATSYAPTLSALVSQRLIDILATRKGILVTRTQAHAHAHEIFEQVRQQNGLKLTDDEIIKTYKVPRDIFLKDMIFRVQAERLLAADIAERNGHSIGIEDWAEVRELFAALPVDDQEADRSTLFAEAKERIEGWVKEVQEGKSFADAAREHNENFTRASGGLRGPTLRGTGTPNLEQAIYRLKPGEMTPPIRAANGWYVFKMERRGAQISAEERERGWKNVVEAKRLLFVHQLRKSARVSSRIPLPVDTPPAARSNPPAASPEMPPPPPSSKIP